MPEMSGDEATARLKANPATKDIPVIINTAFDMGNRTDRALNAGAEEILHKPFDLTMLRAVLDRYLSSGRSQENSCG
jgi:CheY-like chemotaxis protein